MVDTSCSTAIIKLKHWHIPHAANNSTYHQRTNPKLIPYLHAMVAGSPPVKTWCKYAVTEIIQINMTMGIHLTGCYKNSVIF